MQAWITQQLTKSVAIRTIPGVRPKPSTTPAAYVRAFCQRVRASRVRSGKPPREMAQLLGVPKDTYHRYETRTLLPLYLLERFCRITDEDLQWLVTGKDPGNDLLPRPQPDPEAPRATAGRLAPR
jgi:hypothetical protein